MGNSMFGNFEAEIRLRYPSKSQNENCWLLESTGVAQSAHHREVERPWGTYDSVDRGERYQVKRIHRATWRQAEPANAPPPCRALGHC